MLIRAFFSPVDYLWWMDFYLILACLVVYLLTVFQITGPGWRMIVVIGLFVLAMAEFVIAIRQFKLGDNWMPFGLSRPNTGARASGTFISPIQLAGYLEAVGAMAVSLTVWTSWKGWVRIVFGYIAVICYAGVAISGSRGGYMSSLFSLVVFAMLTAWTLRRISPERYAGAFIVTLIAVAAFVGVALLAMQQSRLLVNRLHTIRELGVRISNWGAAVDQWATAPTFGTGAGTHLYYGRFFRRAEIQADPEHAHSDYLETLAEYGLVGLAGMSVVIFLHCYSGVLGVAASAKAASVEPFAPIRDNRLALQIGALSALAAYLVHSMTDFNLHVPGNALMFAFFFGIMANPDPETLGAPVAGAVPGSRSPLFSGPASRARCVHSRDLRSAVSRGLLDGTGAGGSALPGCPFSGDLRREGAEPRNTQSIYLLSAWASVGNARASRAESHFPPRAAREIRGRGPGSACDLSAGRTDARLARACA